MTRTCACCGATVNTETQITAFWRFSTHHGDLCPRCATQSHCPAC